MPIENAFLRTGFLYKEFDQLVAERVRTSVLSDFIAAAKLYAMSTVEGSISRFWCIGGKALCGRLLVDYKAFVRGNTRC